MCMCFSSLPRFGDRSFYLQQLLFPTLQTPRPLDVVPQVWSTYVCRFRSAEPTAARALVQRLILEMLELSNPWPTP